MTINDCTHGGDCQIHPDAQGLHNYDDANVAARWEMPAEPAVPFVRDRHGRLWTLSTYTNPPNLWWCGEPGEGMPHVWHELLGEHGPLTEASTVGAGGA